MPQNPDPHTGPAATFAMVPAESLDRLVERIDRMEAALDRAIHRADGWMTVAEYRRIAQVTTRTVNRRIADGSLEATGTGAGRMVRARR